MTAQTPVLRRPGHAYNIFILVLTIFSLAVMGLLVIPWLDPETRSLLLVYDNACCVIFLIDFAATKSRPVLGSTTPRRHVSTSASLTAIGSSCGYCGGAMPAALIAAAKDW